MGNKFCYNQKINLFSIIFTAYYQIFFLKKQWSLDDHIVKNRGKESFNNVSKFEKTKIMYKTDLYIQYICFLSTKQKYIFDYNISKLLCSQLI